MYDVQAQEKIFVSRGRPIHRRTGQGFHIEILEHESLRWMRFGENDVQSAINLCLPWYPVAAYSRSMLSALCLRPLPERILSLGLGGGSLERFFAAKLPAVEIVSVEPNSAVTQLAFDYFHLPAGISVIDMSGEDYLKKGGALQDLIFVDMCDAQGDLPCLGQQKFHQDLAHNLTPQGITILNAIVTTEAELLRLLLVIRPIFPHIVLSLQPASQNVILLCSQQPLPSIAEAKQRAKTLFQLLDIDFSPILAGNTYLPTPEYQ